MLYIIFAFFSGFMTIVSMIINSKLAMRIGIFQGILINYLVGLLFSIIVLLFNYKSIDFSVDILYYIPLWACLGGAVGVVCISINNIVIPKIGAIYSTLLIFIGQLSMGLAIDSLVGNPISKGKVIGGLLILGGMVYNSYIDKRDLIDCTVNHGAN